MRLATVVPPCGMGTKLEPICGREAAVAAGSPQAKSRAAARDQAPEPICGREAAVAAGSPQAKSRAAARDQPPEPICGREAASAAGSPHSGTKSRSRQAGEGPTDRCAPFLLLACSWLLVAGVLIPRYPAISCVIPPKSRKNKNFSARRSPAPLAANLQSKCHSPRGFAVHNWERRTGN
jgi:hypothetical protein